MLDAITSQRNPRLYKAQGMPNLPNFNCGRCKLFETQGGLPCKIFLHRIEDVKIVVPEAAALFTIHCFIQLWK